MVRCSTSVFVYMEMVLFSLLSDVAFAVPTTDVEYYCQRCRVLLVLTAK